MFFRFLQLFAQMTILDGFLIDFELQNESKFEFKIIKIRYQVEVGTRRSNFGDFGAETSKFGAGSKNF